MLNWNDPLAAFTNETRPNAVIKDNILEDKTSETLATESIQAVNVDDKRVVNGLTDINQLAPFKYPWAWEFFFKREQKPLDTSGYQYVQGCARLPSSINAGRKTRI